MSGYNIQENFQSLVDFYKHIMECTENLAPRIQGFDIKWNLLLLSNYPRTFLKELQPVHPESFAVQIRRNNLKVQLL